MEPIDGHMQLQSLPRDILGVIVSKVGAMSPIDYVNTILSTKKLMFSFHDFFVAKELNLSPLVEKPLRAKRYQSLMNCCLKVNNLDAHYIKGILEYFDTKNQFLGLHHLRVASKGGHKEGRYLYGMILISLGMIEKGKKVLNKLVNKVGITIFQSCWVNIQVSLKNINLQMKMVYLKSLEIMKPAPNCHPPELNTSCSVCFHYYVLSEFVDMLAGLKPTPTAITEA